MTSRQTYMVKTLRNALATARRRHSEIDSIDILYALEFIRVVLTEELIKKDLPHLRPPALPSGRKPYA